MYARSSRPLPGRQSMNADTIREFVRRQPFEPFAIRLSNG
jgi:hypothetical protein